MKDSQHVKYMIALDERRVKESLTYSLERNEVEGYEEFGSLGRTKYITNHAIALPVRVEATGWLFPQQCANECWYIQSWLGLNMHHVSVYRELVLEKFSDNLWWYPLKPQLL